MSNKNFRNSISGKGYYIALVLCAVAIGITGYLYYRNAKPAMTDPQGDPSEPVYATVDPNVVGTLPQDTLPVVGENDPVVTPVTGKPERTAAPVQGQAVAGYAMTCLSYNQTTRDWRVHDGIDYAAEAGTPVTAAAEGTVYSVYDHETLGKTVVIRHTGGYVTKYSSLAEEVTVKAGDKVTLGQKIGTVGSTALMESAIGDHLHFSVSCNDESVDPLEFLS